MSMFLDANWLHLARRERVAVIAGSNAPVFMTLAEFGQANREVLDEMVSNADGHDVTACIFSGDDLILDGAPQVRVTLAVKCPSCGVEAVEYSEFDGCRDPLCAGQAKGRDMERLCMGATS